MTNREFSPFLHLLKFCLRFTKANTSDSEVLETLLSAVFAGRPEHRHMLEADENTEYWTDSAIDTMLNLLDFVKDEEIQLFFDRLAWQLIQKEREEREAKCKNE